MATVQSICGLLSRLSLIPSRNGTNKLFTRSINAAIPTISPSKTMEVPERVTDTIFNTNITTWTKSLMHLRISNNMGNTILPPTIHQIRSIKSRVTFRTLEQMHEDGPPPPKKKKKSPMGPDVPMARAIVLKTVIKHPRKPNSANRKCVLCRIPRIGKEMIAFVPGEGHPLKEHDVVMVIPKRLRDTPSVKLTCVRGKYDLPHVVKEAE